MVGGHLAGSASLSATGATRPQACPHVPPPAVRQVEDVHRASGGNGVGHTKACLS